MRKLLGTTLTLALLLLSFPVARTHAQGIQVSASAQVRERFGIERYLNIRAAGSPTFSANGDRVAFLTNITGTPQVWMVGAGGGWPDQLTYYTDRVDFVQWSPDGTGLVFGKARGGDENSQLFWLAPDGSDIRALTDAPKVRHNFGEWSHDGRRISYASNKRDPNFFDIYVMDVATGREDMVYQQDGSNGVAAWSDDGRYLVVSHNNEQLSLDNDLFLVDTQTRAATLLTQHQGSAQFGDVHFTRDGRYLIFGTNDNREFYQLARMDLQTKRMETLDDAPWDLDASAISDDGRMFAYTLNRDGYSELYVREVAPDGTLAPKGAPVALPGKGLVGALEFSRDNRRLGFSFNGARYNPDVWLYDTGSRALTQLTHSSRAGIPQSTFVEPELVRFKSFDGREIPAWYFRPQVAMTTSANPGMQISVTPGNSNTSTINVTAGNTSIGSVTIGAGGAVPVIVSVHGGPEGQERPGFSGIYQYFLSRGYGILAPNVRGSTGYGKTFTHLDDVRNREDSVKDLAAAVDWLKTQGGADPRRVAVMGGSYGGYMTLAAITLYPELWAAAVDTVGIANFESFLKNTSGYRRKLREVEYGSLERDLEYLRSISPLYKVDRIRTPLFVIQGKNDPRVPYTEAEQIVEALRKRNAPVEYKLFDDEGHGIGKLSNRLIVYPMVANFLDRYMVQRP
ncbi:MAG TPA: S9 family peptidase [Pyrinomonadaceae bacterium]|jgi:dipeptidyl aminopeptidase/acylaminoacyl peptidase